MPVIHVCNPISGEAETQTPGVCGQPDLSSPKSTNKRHHFKNQSKYFLRNNI